MWTGTTITDDYKESTQYDVELITNLQLSFAIDETERRFNFTIYDDDIPELEERFALSVGKVDNIYYLPRTNVLILIEDDDLTGNCLFVCL